MTRIALIWERSAFCTFDLLWSPSSCGTGCLPILMRVKSSNPSWITSKCMYCIESHQFFRTMGQYIEKLINEEKYNHDIILPRIPLRDFNLWSVRIQQYEAVRHLRRCYQPGYEYVEQLSVKEPVRALYTIDMKVCLVLLLDIHSGTLQPSNMSTRITLISLCMMVITIVNSRLVTIS